MRATYACGELSATSSSTSISFTTAAPNSAWSSGTSSTPRRSLGRTRPLDHHRHARGLEPAAQHLGLDLAAIRRARPDRRRRRRRRRRREMGRLVGHERDAAIGALRGAGSVLGAARRAPQRRFVHGATASVRGCRRYDGGNVRRLDDRKASFYVETLGCPKNAVDSDKVVASLLADGLVAGRRPRPTPISSSSTPARSSRPPARSRSTSRSRSPTPQARRRQARGHRLHGRALRRRARRRAARGRRGRRLRGRGLARRRRAARPQAGRRARPARAAAARRRRAPWAYVKVAEGCDRACAFCAIPSFRGKQRSRTPESIEAEVRGARRAAASPRSCSSRRTSPGTGATSASPVRSRRCCAASTRSRRTGSRASACSTSTRREVHDPLVSTMLELPTVVPYFDLSLQHVGAGSAAPHEALGERRPLPRRSSTASAPQEPDAAFRSSFIVGFPGETERDHDELLAFLDDGARSTGPASSRSRAKTARRPPTLDGDGRRRSSCASGCASAPRCRSRSPTRPRDALVGREIEVLVDGVDDDGVLVGRTHREAPGDRRRRAPRRRPDRRVRPPGRDRARDRERRRRAPIWKPRPLDVTAAAVTATRVDARGEALRAERARDAGQLRHARPHPRRDPDAALIRRRRLVVARRSGCGSRSPPPTVSTAGSRAATARPVRARSSIRSPTS